MSQNSPIIDAQVHAYERDRPERPWAGWLHGPLEVTGDDMVAEMDAVGVDGALLVSPWTMYRYDAAYALEVHARHPGRFGLIKPFDPNDPDVAEQVAHWASTPGVVGARIMLSYEGDFSAGHEGLGRILTSAASAGLPVNVLCWGNRGLFAELARKYPDTRMVVDHLGLQQPFEPPPPEDGFAALDEVLALATLDNVAIKITGACTLARTPFPYPDIWGPLRRIFDAYGLERCMWGTDWTRATGLLTYRQAVASFRSSGTLTDAERDMLMGGALSNIYGWAPGENR